MSDEVLIERIRTAMRAEVDDVHVRPELLAPVLHSPPRRRLQIGWLMPALAVGVAAVVAVLAVTSLVHRTPQPAPSVTRIPLGARELASQLAVLRRPQTAADRLPPWALRAAGPQLPGGALVAGLSRRVGTVRMGRLGEARVYLVIDAPSRSSGWQAYASAGDVAGIAFLEDGPSARRAGQRTVFVGGLVPSRRTGIDNLADVTGIMGAKAAIVPNGVARVKWVFTPMGRDSGLAPITVWPKLHGNVAIGQVPAGLQDYLSSAVWYGADGRVLRSFGAMTGVPPGVRKFRQALQTSLHDPVAPSLLRNFRVLRMPGHSTSLDRRAVGSLLNTEGNALDLNVSKARVVVVPGIGAKIWLIPGTQGVGVFYISQNSGPEEVGIEGILDGMIVFEGSQRAGHRTIVGLAPDADRKVRVLLAGGGVLTAPVINNVYSIVVPSSARRLLIRNPAGHLFRLRI